MKKIIGVFSFCLLMPSLALAKNLTFDLLAALGESDNALKSDVDEVNEKQNRYTASLNGNWDKQWVNANMQYTAYREMFADDSQDEQNYLQGDSSLTFGNASNLLNLDLRHSRRTLLKDITESPINSNQEEREIFSVIPSMRFDVTSSDELVLTVDTSRTRYLETEFKDSDRNVYGVDFQHGFSAVDRLNIRLSKTESDFVYFPQADYNLSSAVLVYSANLRKLSYSLGVGQEKTEPEFSESQSSPHYEASMSYISGQNQFRIFVDQSVTDSSFGQGLSLNNSVIPGVDSAFDEIGLIDRKTSGIDVAREMTARSTLTLGVSKTDDEFVNSDAESTQLGGTASLRYSFSPRATLTLSHSLSDVEAISFSLNDQYRQSFTRISFRYQFFRSFDLELFREKEKRASDTGQQSYLENFTGISLGYHFE